MKNTKTSANKKIMASASMLLVSAFMLSSATYAWFTMNKTVTVTGMQMKTTVGSNLLVSPDETEANFVKDITLSRKALLEPVSTVNGLNYFYTVNAKADGDAIVDDYVAYSETESNTDTNAAKDAYSPAFNTAYGITPNTSAEYGIGYGYVDYAFYIKATSTEAGQAVVMTECNLLYNGAVIGDATGQVDKAWRTAVFVQKLGDGNQTACATGIAPGASGGASLVSIIKRDGAVNQTANYAVSAAATAPTEISSTIRDAAVVVDDTIAANTTEYYYVVVRVYLEGEDTTCTSATYAQLTNAWELGVKFELKAGTSDATDEIVSDASGVRMPTATPTPNP